MQKHDLLYDGQTQTGAARFARARFVHAVEAVEDVQPVFLRDADAVVRDAHHGGLALL